MSIQKRQDAGGPLLAMLDQDAVKPRRVHPHTRKAYQSGKQAIGDREQAIVAELRRGGPGTDRQIARRMGFAEKSAVQPRITDLVKVGVLREVGHTRDELTGRTVRVVVIAAD